MNLRIIVSARNLHKIYLVFCVFFRNFAGVKLYSDKALAKILDKDIFHQISEVADEMGVECYVVGGYVRDIFLERPSNDIDVVVVGKPQAQVSSPTGEGERSVSVGISVAKALKNRMGKRAHLSVFKNFGTAQVKVLSNLPPLGEASKGAATSPSGGRQVGAPLEVEFVGARKESYSHVDSVNW